MRKIILAFVTAFSIFIFSKNDAYSQDTKDQIVTLDFGSDIYSRYIWRGQQFGGTSPSIQPYINVSVKNLEIGYWGAYSLNGLTSGQELDFHITYSFLNDMFSATVTDYFFPDNSVNYNYFDYRSDSTGHILEGTFSFNGTENIPVTFMAAMNFYGADAAKIESNPSSPNFNQKIGIQYSNYFELGYSTTVNDVDFNLFTGFTLSNPKAANTATAYIGENGFYGSHPGVVNLGISLSKSVKITDNYSLPLSSSWVVNPETKKIYMIFGISF